MDATPVRIGDVSGPKSAVTDNNFASWDGVSGRLIKDSGSNASSFDTAGAAAAVQGTLDTHVGLTGTDVHGLGTMSTATATDYYTIVQSDLAYDALGAASTVQGNLDTHVGLEGTDVHGLGTIATQAADNVDLSGGTISGMTSIAATGQISTTSTDADSIETAGGITFSDRRFTAFGSASTILRSNSASSSYLVFASTSANQAYLGSPSSNVVTFLDSSGAVTNAQVAIGTSTVSAGDTLRVGGRAQFDGGTTPSSATSSQVNIGNGRVDVGTKLTVRGTAADSIETAGGIKAAAQKVLQFGNNTTTQFTDNPSEVNLGSTAGTSITQTKFTLFQSTTARLGISITSSRMNYIAGTSTGYRHVWYTGDNSGFVERGSIGDNGLQILGTTPASATADKVNIGNGIIDSGTEYRVAGTKVVGAQGAAIADAAEGSGTATDGGWGFDSEAEFNDFITAFNALKDSHNTLLSRARAHGLIAT